MAISKADVKEWLRIDFDDDDSLLDWLIDTANDVVSDVRRDTEEDDEREDTNIDKLAYRYAVTILYENRENLNMRQLKLTLRDILVDERRVEF